MSHFFIFIFQIVEVGPEELDEDTLYTKYAVKANNNNKNSLGTTFNERSASICAELSVTNIGRDVQ